MKAKHWLMTGSGCVAGSILFGVITMLWWLSQMRSLSHDREYFEPRDPFQLFGVLVAAQGLIALLFIGGIIVLIVGFIFLAKEPRTGPERETRSEV